MQWTALTKKKHSSCIVLGLGATTSTCAHLEAQGNKLSSFVKQSLFKLAITKLALPPPRTLVSLHR